MTPRVLLTVASFLPTYGGPALSVSRLGTALASFGVRIGLWAPDGSAPRSEITRELESVALLAGTTEEAFDRFSPDVVHDNGIWLRHNHSLAMIAAQRKVQRVVSPRGMLEPWAFRYKPWKKQLAWRLYQRRDMETAAAIHVTSEQEALSVNALSLGRPTFVASNGVDLPTVGDASRSLRSTLPRTALFLSRIHPKKGLAMLVDGWARVRPADWQLIIAGSDELGHANEIARRIELRDLRHCVRLVGPKYGSDKADLWSKSALFILPTFSENFGMVIAEALAHSVPVLTTNTTPWRELVARDCGWWVKPSLDEIACAISDATSRSSENLAAMGMRGREYVAGEFTWETVARKLLDVYLELRSDRRSELHIRGVPL